MYIILQLANICTYFAHPSPSRLFAVLKAVTLFAQLLEIHVSVVPAAVAQPHKRLVARHNIVRAADLWLAGASVGAEPGLAGAGWTRLRQVESVTDLRSGSRLPGARMRNAGADPLMPIWPAALQHGECAGRKL